MKRILSYCGMLLMVLLIATGCGGAKVQNIDNSGYISGSKVTTSKVERAIKKGAARKGWMTKRVKTGLLEARNNVRGRHLVVVNINYNTKGYKITYKDSQNMKYNPETQTIHGNYNKWVASLERNINYELSQIGVAGNVTSSSSSSQPVTHIQPKAKTAKSTNYKYAGDANLQGKTIYIKNITPYSSSSRIADNIKAECTLDQQLAEFVKKYAQQNGLKVEYKNNVKSTDLFLDLQITNAVSQGGAFRGHNKFVTIQGTLAKGSKSYGSFKAGRISGGGFWGAYKSSCSVLGRTVNTLGQDVAFWLSSPTNNARLGDTYLIQ